MKHKVIKSGGLAFFTVLSSEGVEMLLESAIAWFVTNALTMLVLKIVATFTVVTTARILVKPLCRAITEKFIYQKGEDKMEKLKSLWEIVKANKCSIAIIILSAILAMSGSSLINVNALPQIPIGEGKVIDTVIQEEDIVATEIVWEKEPVIATEVIYGAPIFSTEVVWEKEPVIATEIVWEKEPVIAQETIYLVEPVIADKLLFVADVDIYEADGETIKYAKDSYVPNVDAPNYIDKVKVFNAGDVVREGTVLYREGDIIKEGIKKYDIGDIIEEGIVKYDIGDYVGNEILFNVGDIIEEGVKKYDIGDIITPAGTVLEEGKVVPPTNLTPILYYLVLSACVAVAGVFFEKPKDYAIRKENEQLKKQAKKEIVDEENKVILEEKQREEAVQQAKTEAENRRKLDQIKADIRAGKV